jgi:hypothetical protein
MKLRKAEAFGVLDDHEGGPGHVNSHFHNRCPDQEMHPACAEISHGRFPFLGRQSAVHQSYPVSRTQDLGQLLGHVRGVFQI